MKRALAQLLPTLSWHNSNQCCMEAYPDSLTVWLCPQRDGNADLAAQPKSASTSGASSAAGLSSDEAGAVEPMRVRYSYYTAGSGGVGPTILETSLLLASQPVLAYVDGKQVQTGNIAWLCRECCDPMAQSQLSRLIQWLSRSSPASQTTHNKLPAVDVG